MGNLFMPTKKGVSRFRTYDSLKKYIIHGTYFWPEQTNYPLKFTAVMSDF